jgi:aspartate racemase
MKTLGILGGMGPEAGLRFCDLLLQKAVADHGATKNADFPHFLLNSLPVPDLIENRDDEEKTVAMVEKGARDLRLAGADVLVMTCNTMHLFADRFQKASGLPFPSVIDAVVTSVKRDHRKKVGILGSLTTMRSRLYVDPLTRLGIEPIQPMLTEQERLVASIQRVIARQATDDDRATASEIIQSLQKRGADAVILGCTELPFIVCPEDQSLPIYDSIEILAERSCDAIYS